jgi:hypothetical protein
MNFLYLLPTFNLIIFFFKGVPQVPMPDLPPDQDNSQLNPLQQTNPQSQ